MPSANKWLGFLTLNEDPILRTATGGVPVANLKCTINQKYKDKKTNQYVDDPVFIDVVVWGKNATHIAKHLTRGSEMYADCKLKMNTWTDRNTGKQRTIIKLEIVAPPQFIKTKGYIKPKGDYEEAPIRPESNYVNPEFHDEDVMMDNLY